MTRKVQVHQVDAFTREPFTGNPTGVVLNADALSEAQMLAIARELNNAETAFILAPDADDHTVRARFFTPRSEAGFVGHATIAAQYVLSRRHEAPRWQRQKSKAGIVDIEVRGSDEDRRIAIRRSPPPIGRELNDRERLAVLDALALASESLDTRIPPRIVGAAGTRLLIGVRGPEPLKQLKPDLARLTTLSAQIGAAGYFVFTLVANATDHLTEARMFCPALGIAEDPVSGNAHGLLGAYLARLGLLARNGERAGFCGVQGYSLHRPGRVEVELEFAGGDLGGVWISGQAVSIFQTEIEF
ncbi:MAG: PhzF family phenazine biosynthesis isomerase [Gammaproteobacteria bacterium]|nr:PhzF family phenazine biosynthesis isomerase [Gammaproteobacteria bacterium]MBV9315889.1 PhzF family phenazine biosynthesis isomerase [Gammaproteobacteria bacterium]MBV9726996.1 PhzF family phenazine biosynthesis isomerase [Gammaproteobacteria bacterium]